jgi:hypothetical protein
MTVQSSNSNPEIQTIGLVLRKKAQQLIDALEDERMNHGDLVTPKRQRAVNELRLALTAGKS